MITFSEKKNIGYLNTWNFFNLLKSFRLDNLGHEQKPMDTHEIITAQTYMYYLPTEYKSVSQVKI